MDSTLILVTTPIPRAAGLLHIGVGVGAVVLDEEEKVFLAVRGPQASNDQSLWATPGGEVEFGETLAMAICREVWEEFGMKIVLLNQLAAFDHFLRDGQEHWLSVAFVARHVSGDPKIMEPSKCSAFGWFSLDALPEPLTELSKNQLQAYQRERRTLAVQ